MPLPTPLVLHAGFHGTIVGDGFNSENTAAGDAGDGPPAYWTSDNGGGLVSFVGNRSGAAVQYPENVGTGSPNRYAAAAFAFSPAANSFTDVTPTVGLPAVQDGTAAWGDYDNDGRLDLAMTGTAQNSLVASVYHNDGGGQFHDIQAGLAGNY